MAVNSNKVVRCDTPGWLLEMISGRVGVVHCRGEKLPAYQEKYCVSSITQGKEDFILHLVGGQLPSNADTEHAALTLEDVYMYFFGRQ